MFHIPFIVVLAVLAGVVLFAPYGVVIAATGAIVATAIWLYFLLHGTKPTSNDFKQSRNLLVNVSGSILALFAGYHYFLWSLGKAWWIRPEVSYIGPWLLLAVAATMTVVALLTLVFAPNNRWLYSVMFSSITIAFGVGGLGEPRAAMFWLALGGATFGVGLACSYAVRAVRRSEVAP